MDELEEEEESSSPPEALLALRDLVISFCISSLIDNLSDCRSNSFNLWLSELSWVVLVVMMVCMLLVHCSNFVQQA